MMQFNLLNQYNWRNYPGTVGLLISMINYSGPFCTLTKHESSLPKHIKEIIRQKYSTYKGRQESREAYVKYLKSNPYSPEIFKRFINHIISQMQNEDLIEESVLELGYF